MASIQHLEIDRLLHWMTIRFAALEHNVSLETVEALEATLSLWDEEKIATFIQSHAHQPACTISAHASDGRHLGRRLTLRFQFDTVQQLNSATWKKTFAHYITEVYLDAPDHRIIWVEINGINEDAEE